MNDTNTEIGVQSGGDNYVNFVADDIRMDLKNILISASKENPIVLPAHAIAADLGAGIGNSTLALAQQFPTIEHFTTVDSVQRFDPKIEAYLKAQNKSVIHHNERIQKYLESESPERVHIVLMASVTEHRLQESDYTHLARIVAPSGYVVETGDTFLDETLMSKHFRKIVGLEDVKGWQKKAPQSKP